MGLREYKKFLKKCYEKDRKNRYFPEDVRVYDTRDINSLVYRLHDLKNKVELYQKLNDSIYCNIVSLLKLFENEK